MSNCVCCRLSEGVFGTTDVEQRYIRSTKLWVDLDGEILNLHRSVGDIYARLKTIEERLSIIESQAHIIAEYMNERIK